MWATWTDCAGHYMGRERVDARPTRLTHNDGRNMGFIVVEIYVL